MTIGHFRRCDTGETVDIEYPTCPSCGSTAKQCHRPSGHGAGEWHIEREYLLAPLLGCCADWRAPELALFELEGAS